MLEYIKKYQKVPVEVLGEGNKDEPLCTVCILTYQHGRFIKECLDSVLNQKTSFPLEIIIGEDASTDGTREVCVDYALRYPDIIRLFLHHRENVIKFNKKASGRFNFLYSLANAKGKYISFCEGDDYWSYSYKLQNQVDFLEKNENYSICFHNVQIDNNGEFVEDYIARRVSSITDIYDLAKGNYIHTTSVVFRKELLNGYPEEFIKAPIGDYPLLMYLAQFGKIKKLEINAAVYRLHSNSMWSSIEKSPRRGRIIKYLEILVPYFAYNKMVFKPLYARWKKLSMRWIIELLKTYKFLKALVVIFRAMGLATKFQILHLVR